MILRIILFYLVIRVVAALSLPQAEKRGHIVEYNYNAANDNNNETESEINEENIGRYIYPSPRDHYTVDNEYNIDAAAEKRYLNKLGEEDIVYDIFNEEYSIKDFNNSEENLDNKSKDIRINSIDKKENFSIKNIEDKKNIDNAANSKNINKLDKEDFVTIKKQPPIEAKSKKNLFDKTLNITYKSENDKKNIEMVANRKSSDESVKKLSSKILKVPKNNKTDVLVIEAKHENSVVKKDKAHNILINDQPPMDSTPLDYDALLEEIYKEVLERIEKDEQARSKNSTANDVFFGETIELLVK